MKLTNNDRTDYGVVDNGSRTSKRVLDENPLIQYACISRHFIFTPDISGFTIYYFPYADELLDELDSLELELLLELDSLELELELDSLELDSLELDSLELELLDDELLDE